MNAKTRVLFLVPNLNAGGAERTLLNLLKYIDRSKFDPIVAPLVYRGGFAKHVANEDYAEPFSAAACRGGATGVLSSPVRYALGFFRMAKIICDSKPDVILSFSPSGAIITALWLKVLRLKHIPWIARVGNHMSAEFLPRSKFRLHRKIFKRFSKWAYRNADHVIATSVGIAKDLQGNFNVPAGKISAIYNPIDVDFIQQMSEQPISVPAESFILAVGRLDYQKGFDLLIRAFAQLPAEYNQKLILLGEGPERAKLESLRSSLKLKDRVLLPGMCENPWAYMIRAEVLVVPSRWEGFAHVVVEGMVCKTPVIVTNCGYGPSEIVGEGAFGVVVPSGDIKALYKAIYNVLENRSFARKQASVAFPRVRDFSADAIVKQYESILRSVYS